MNLTAKSPMTNIIWIVLNRDSGLPHLPARANTEFQQGGFKSPKKFPTTPSPPEVFFSRCLPILDPVDTDPLEYAIKFNVSK